MGQLSDLTEIVTIANNDLLLIRDISDVLNPDKKIQRLNLVGATITGGGSLVLTGAATLTVPVSGNAVVRTTTPLAGRVASWTDGNVLQDGGIAAADIYHKTNVLLVDANFTANNSAQHRYVNVAQALLDCVGGETILIAPGIYVGDLTVADDGVKLIGSGAPNFDVATGRLVEGTIIQGRINLTNKVGIQIHHLGIDLFGVNAKDCIASATSNVNLYRRYSHLTLLGNGSAALAHGIYLDGHFNNVDNIRVYNCYHGCAVHGSYNNISNMTFINCSSSALIVKAKSGINCHQVNISNVVMLGDPALTTTRSGPIALQAEDGVEVRRVNVVNVTARYCAIGVVNVVRNDALAGSIISECSFSNISSDGNLDNALVGDYWIKTGNNIMLTNCRSTNRVGGYAYRVDPADNVGDVYLYSSYADASGAGQQSGIFKSSALGAVQTLDSLTVTGRVIAGGFRTLTVSLATDTAVDFPSAVQGMLMCAPSSGGNSATAYLLASIRAAATPICTAISIGANATVGTTALLGTTGTPGKMNVAVTSGHIYIENRLGTTTVFTLFLVG